MHNSVNFILESGISLALLSVIYILFLRRETFFRLNRLFLLVSMGFSILLPFIKFRIFEPQPTLLAEITVTPYRNLMEVVTIYGRDLSGTVVQTISSSQIIIVVYLIGFLFFFSRLAFRITQIVLLVIKNKIQTSGQFKFVFLNKDFSPFSFLNYIFINPEQKNSAGYDKMVIHEMEHIKQGHTFDVLVLEIMTVFQWFNPFMWLLKKVIRENHEFLADSAVLSSGINPAKYKELLLTQFVGFELKLTNNFNSSLIKKRIRMISKMRSSKFANLKYLPGILSVLALLAAFACEQEDSVNMILDDNKTEMQISFFGEKLMIEANTADLNKLKEMFSGKININLESDSLGNYFFAKSKDAPKFLEEGEKIHQLAEKMPEFPGGEMALRNRIEQSIIYPKEAIEKGIMGKVYVSFVVAKNGEIVNCELARGVHKSIDDEAIRVINELPKWTPGKINDQSVNVRYTVPIQFKLAQKNKIAEQTID